MTCPFNPCGGCAELANLNATMATPQNFLTLVHKRHLVKRNHNSWHDRLACRLPVEIISHIFIFLDSVNEPGHPELQRLSALHCQYWDHLLRTPFVLSRVCKRWRDIVLGTPQLWANLILNVWRKSHNLELFKTILSRSGSLPLSLVLHGRYSLEKTSLEPIVQVVRSCSARWKMLDIDYVPDGMAYLLLNNLDHNPTSDIFNLRMGDLGQKPISLREPLRPRQLFVAEMGDNVKMLPLQWANLTHFDVLDMEASTLLDIVQQMPLLTHWVCHSVNFPSPIPNEPFPATPIIIPGLQYLELMFKDNDPVFFRFLTLPALTHLKCQFGDDFPEHIEELVFVNLIDFIARSQLDSKALETFELKYAVVEATTHDLAGLVQLTAITHLHIDILDTSTGRLRPFLWPILDAIVLPNLRELKIEMPHMNSSSWKTLCDLVTIRGDHRHSDNILENSQDPADIVSHPPVHKRRLEHVSVSVYIKKPTIPYKEFAILRDIQNAGVVKLDLQDRNKVDILSKMASIYDVVY